AYEQIVSTRYGLPQVVFWPPSNIRHFSQEVIDRVYTELGDLSMNAERCLRDHGRLTEYPIYTRNGGEDRQRQGRNTIFETQACNLIPGFMAIPVAPETVFYTSRLADWQPITVTSEPYEGPV